MVIPAPKELPVVSGIVPATMLWAKEGLPIVLFNMEREVAAAELFIPYTIPAIEAVIPEVLNPPI